MTISSIRNRGSSMGSDNTLISEGAHEPIDNNPAHQEPEKPVGLLKRLMRKSPAVRFCVCVGAAFGVGMYAGMALSGGPDIADGSAGGLRMDRQLQGMHGHWDEGKLIPGASWQQGITDGQEHEISYNTEPTGPVLRTYNMPYGGSEQGKESQFVDYRDEKEMKFEAKVEISSGKMPQTDKEKSAGGLRLHNEKEFEKSYFKDFPTVKKNDTRVRRDSRISGYDLGKAEAAPIKEYFDVPAGAELAKFEGEVAVADDDKDSEREEKDSETPSEKNDEPYEDFEKAMYREPVAAKLEEAPVNTKKIDQANDKQMKIEANVKISANKLPLTDVNESGGGLRMIPAHGNIYNITTDYLHEHDIPNKAGYSAGPILRTNNIPYDGSEQGAGKAAEALKKYAPYATNGKAAAGSTVEASINAKVGSVKTEPCEIAVDVTTTSRPPLSDGFDAAAGREQLNQAEPSLN